MEHHAGTTPTASARDYADKIAGIWCPVLGLDRCEPDANFFDLGGTSLKMMRIHAELTKQLNFDVSIVELFAHPTVNTLAERLVVLQATQGGLQPAFPAAGARSGPLARMFRPLKTQN